jgi:ribosomal protein S18 acetylase RimI-like enzyme
MTNNFQPFWTPYLKDIDVKSYDYPWLDEWNALSKYILNGVIRQEGDDFRVVGFYAVKPGVTCVIHKLAVRPAFRKQGIGTELLADIEERCAGWKLGTMEVVLHEENDLGINWAQSQGFKAVGMEIEMFPDGRDGIIMGKEL